MKVLPAVITSLERKASNRGDALALGLHTVAKKYKFIATLYMMCDVLPLVSWLSRIFQFSAIDLSAMHKYVPSTTTSLSLLKEQLGPCLRKLDNDLQSSLAQFDISCSVEVKESFKKEVQEHFVTESIKHIKLQGTTDRVV